MLSERINKLFERPQETDAFGKEFGLCLERIDTEKEVLVFRGSTLSSMKNIAGIVHGGMCAALIDQAMGIVAYCLNDSDNIAPTIQLQLSYHRPLLPEEEVEVRVGVTSVSRSLISLSAQVYMTKDPDKICLSSSGTFFRK